MSMEFVGFDEVSKVLQAVEGILPASKIEALLRQAAKPYLKAAKENASHHDVTGGASKSIGSVKDKTVKGSASILLGPRRDRGYKGHHFHLLEYGSGPRKLSKPIKIKIRDKWVTITHTGTMPATPILRPAWDAKGQEVLNQIKEVFGKEITGSFKNLIK